MSNSKFFTKLVLLVLVLSMSIFSTACNFETVLTNIFSGIYSVNNYFFNDLSLAEWNIALNQSSFNNVTIFADGEEIHIVDGEPYIDGTVVDNEDGNNLVLKIIMDIISNCYKDDFTYDSSKNVYCANKKISYSISVKIDEIDATVYGEASNLILSFDSDRHLEYLLCNITLNVEALGYEENMDVVSLNAKFSDYGTTSITN